MNEYRGYVFDLDGTIYLGDHLIEGADRVIRFLQSRQKSILFLTNKTIESREKYVAKLNSLGIRIDISHILSPTVTLIQYIQKNHPQSKLYIIGEEIIKNEMEESGLALAKSAQETDIVVISWDRNFHYDHLDFAYQAIKSGARTIATNPDRTCPVQGGEVPDCGGMIGAIEGVTGKAVDVMIGKPSPITARAVLSKLKIDASQCLVVGDRLETDVLMGNNAGMQTALVLTGITQNQEVHQSSIKPDYILSSVAKILPPQAADVNPHE